MGCLGILGNLVNMGKLGGFGGLGRMSESRKQGSLADASPSSLVDPITSVSPSATLATLPNGCKCVILHIVKGRATVRHMNTTTLTNIELSRLMPY